MLEEIIVALLVFDIVRTSAMDYIQNKKIRKCKRQIEEIKKQRFGDKDALGAISKIECIAIEQIAQQLESIGYCWKCPLYQDKYKARKENRHEAKVIQGTGYRNGASALLQHARADK